MRPTLRLLDDDLVDRIVAEARDVLCSLGVEIHNPAVLDLLGDHGAEVDAAGERGLTPTSSMPPWRRRRPASGSSTSPASRPTTSRATTSTSRPARRRSTSSTARPARCASPTPPTTCATPSWSPGSTTSPRRARRFIPADVPERISDSYRLFLSLLYCEKPVVTGAFTVEAFEVMRDLQLAVRGSAEALAAKPLTVFSCCPTSPLKWSDVTSQNVVDCAALGHPGRVHLDAAVRVHGAGDAGRHAGPAHRRDPQRRGHQPARPPGRAGAVRRLAGGLRHPLRDDADGRHRDHDDRLRLQPRSASYLGLPTQAYIALSDAKQLDAQAGLETGIGATLAALSGINSISGPGHARLRELPEPREAGGGQRDLRHDRAPGAGHRAEGGLPGRARSSRSCSATGTC